MDYTDIGKKMLFQEMTDGEINKCLTSLNATEKNYKKGTVILRAGDITDRMGMVISGSVTIESNDVWGNCTILSY